jgi:hypothetical protein
MEEVLFKEGSVVAEPTGGSDRDAPTEIEDPGSSMTTGETSILAEEL